MVSIDGTDISDVTIDGTDVQEITIDGTVAWVRLSYPNSISLRYPFDEGSGTTAADAVGSNTGTLVSDSWTANSSLVGGYGVPVQVDAANVLNIGTSGSVTVAATVDTADLDADGGTIFFNHASGEPYFVMTESQSQSGYVGIGVYDGAWLIEQHANVAGNYSGLVRFVGVYDLDNGTATLYANANSLTREAGDQNLQLTDGLSFGARPDGNGVYGNVIDNPTYYDTGLSASEVQDDYDKQPWS